MGSVGDATAPSALSKDVLLLHIPPPPNQEWIARMTAKFPGLEVRWAAHGFNLMNPIPVPDDMWEGVTLVCLMTPPPDASKLDNIRFIQLPSAGADHWIQHPKFQDPNVPFCTSNGVHA
jgi:hypothetical protein